MLTYHVSCWCNWLVVDYVRVSLVLAVATTHNADVCLCVALIEEGYHGSNPYHNAVHALDVAQAMHCYVNEQKVLSYQLEHDYITYSCANTIRHLRSMRRPCMVCRVVDVAAHDSAREADSDLCVTGARCRAPRRQQRVPHRHV